MRNPTLFYLCDHLRCVVRVLVPILLLGVASYPSRAQSLDDSILINPTSTSSSNAHLVERGKSFDKNLVGTFRSGLEAFKRNDEKEFSELLTHVRQDLTREGFVNAPDFSLELLRLYYSGAEDSPEIQSELVHWAVVLSPSHPEVLLTASSVEGASSFKNSARLFIDGLSNLMTYPFTLVSSASRLCVAGLTSLVIALFSLVLILVMLRTSDILSSLAIFFPRSIRSYASVLLLAAFVCVPLMLPFPICICIWSIMLGWSVAKFRYLPLISGFVLLLVYLLPSSLVMTIRASESIQARALQNVRMNNYSMLVERDLRDALKISPNDPLLLSLVGQLCLLSDRLSEASALFERAYHHGSHSRGLEYISGSSLALIQYRLGQVEKAYAGFQALYANKWREEELLSNLVVLSVELFKDADYKKYYAEFVKEYPEAVSGDRVGNTDLLLPRIPRDLLFSFLSILREREISASQIAMDGSSQANLPEILTSDIDMRILAVFMAIASLFLRVFKVGEGYRLRSSLFFKRPLMSGRIRVLRYILPGFIFIEQGRSISYLILSATCITFLLSAFRLPIGFVPEQDVLLGPMFTFGILFSCLVQGALVSWAREGDNAN